jgi:hypothetical protein
MIPLGTPEFSHEDKGNFCFFLSVKVITFVWFSYKYKLKNLLYMQTNYTKVSYIWRFFFFILKKSFINCDTHNSSLITFVWVEF